MITAISPHNYRGALSEIHFNSNKEKTLSITIDTERLHIRSLEADDFPFCAQLYSNEDVMSMFCTGKTLPEERVRSIFEKFMHQRRESSPYGAFAVLTKTEEFLGLVSLTTETTANAPGIVELGGLGFPTYWKNGYGGEAATAVVREYSLASVQEGYLVHGAPLHKIIATAHPQNIGSWKILEKLGMHFEKEEERYGSRRRFYALEL